MTFVCLVCFVVNLLDLLVIQCVTMVMLHFRFIKTGEENIITVHGRG